MKTLKNYAFIVAMLLVSTTIFTSCVKEEALNSEADIVHATIKDADVLLQTEPLIKGDEVTFKLKPFSTDFIFAPEFVITEGATIEPASGTERNFSEPQEYTVTSENGALKRVYTVSFTIDGGILSTYSFENAKVIEADNPIGIYHQFFDYSDDMTTPRFDWDSGNFGYNMLAETLLEEGEELTPAFYPTAQTDDGYIGKGAVMQTKDTGEMGTIFQSPLAAGSLYLGYFQFDLPSIKSTRFGQPYTHTSAPKSILGFFKYKAGEQFIVNNEPSALTQDTWDAYAILFEKQEGDNFLSGDHGFEDDRIVSVARISDEYRVETDEWTPFEMDFEFVNGKSFDPEKEYMFTIVFSSSKEGDIFNGAVGSVLHIDEVNILTED